MHRKNLTFCGRNRVVRKGHSKNRSQTHTTLRLLSCSTIPAVGLADSVKIVCTTKNHLNKIMHASLSHFLCSDLNITHANIFKLISRVELVVRTKYLLRTLL